jgi:hypothetical protein
MCKERARDAYKLKYHQQKHVSYQTPQPPKSHEPQNSEPQYKTTQEENNKKLE